MTRGELECHGAAQTLSDDARAPELESGVQIGNGFRKRFDTVRVP